MRRFLAALALLVVAPVVPVAAQETGDASVRLVDQPAHTTIGEVLTLRLRVEGTTEGMDLRLDLHGALSTRTGFEASVRGEDLGRPTDSATAAVADLPTVGRARDRVLRVRIGGDPDPFFPRLVVRSTGVYPLTVSLLDGTGDTVDAFTTWLVAVTSGSDVEHLRVAWVWSFAAAPLLDRDGGASGPLLAQLRAGGRLDDVATLLGDARGVPVSLRVSPQTVALWGSEAESAPALDDSLRAFRTATRRDDVDVVAGPYVPLDIPAVEQAGLGDVVGDEMLRGVESVQRTLDLRVDARTAFVEPADDVALARLRTLLVDRVVVRESGLEPVDRRLTPARPFTLESAGATFRAAATSDGLHHLLDTQLASPEPAALRSQRFLAGLSLVALEAPARTRGVVVAEPLLWSPEPALVQAVLEGLDDHPLVEAVTLDDYFAQVPDDDGDDGDEPLVRGLVPAVTSPLPFTAGEFRDTRARLSSFTSIVGDDDVLVARGDEALRVAPSSLLDAQEARAELDGVSIAIGDVLSRISTAAKTVTLTEREADIPISFRNDTGQPVTVRIRLDSQKLLFPDGADRVVELAEGNTTERFVVEARTSGQFPLTVTLTSVDGFLAVDGPTRLTIRSTVFGGVGVFITAGALVFLVFWWGRYFRRARRRRRALAPGGEDLE